MSPVLADTSAWVDLLRLGRESETAQRLADSVEAGDAVLCGPVLAELLASTRADQRESLRRHMLGLAWVELRRTEWERVGALAAELRSAGRSVPLTDVEIAVAALSAAADLLTLDSDFGRIADVEPALRVVNLGIG